MIISENLLLAHGAVYVNYTAKDEIFNEGGTPKFYYQIVKGIVELNNYHNDGKEFTHSILTDGECLGESSLFNDHAYPVNAVAKSDCSVLRLAKDNFLNLVKENPSVTSILFKCISDRLINRYKMSFNITSSDPAKKLRTVIEYLKSSNSVAEDNDFEVPLTRQQLANLTGLRVETVIRSIKKLEKENILKIENRRIFY
ncbi:Crp/Fnr family transcriptional regulator [Chryseobacterium terrae]|uniref:Crp/Fnr family transcriptional regulator n=1 Tax=Chryseobacterium terrae TaxID=3163299 RepID=A0ABW8Y1U3_9FLAO